MGWWVKKKKKGRSERTEKSKREEKEERTVKNKLGEGGKAGRLFQTFGEYWRAIKFVRLLVLFMAHPFALRFLSGQDTVRGFSLNMNTNIRH